MALHAPRSKPWRVVALILLILVVAGGVAGAALYTTTTTTSTTTSPPTTTTSIAKERHQLGWTNISSSARGIMVDYRTITVGTVSYRAVRLRARTTLLRWHVGSTDPNLWAKAPFDSGPQIAWPTEGRAGVVAVFNGAFKQSAKAGGAVVDGVTLNPLVSGDMTIVLNRAGHWEMGVWGSPGFPTPGFDPISYRQNLVALVANGAVTTAARSTVLKFWGDPLREQPFVARTGLGIDAQGNLIYVASEQGALAVTLAQALVNAGAVTAMELDINPYWPILGAPTHPIHGPNGVYQVQLPNAEHSPNIYDYGWTRDFFVALAEPSSWSCAWQSPGLKGGVKGVQPQPLALVGKGCSAVKHRHPTTSTTHR